MKRNMLLSRFPGSPATHQVGRVAPRPQNRGHDWTLLGSKPLPKKSVVVILSGLTGQGFTGDSAFAKQT